MIDGNMSMDMWFSKKSWARQGGTGGIKERHVADVELNVKGFSKPVVECHVVACSQ